MAKPISDRPFAVDSLCRPRRWLQQGRAATAGGDKTTNDKVKVFGAANERVSVSAPPIETSEGAEVKAIHDGLPNHGTIRTFLLVEQFERLERPAESIELLKLERLIELSLLTGCLMPQVD
jgi:hypothetical protein